MTPAVSTLTYNCFHDSLHLKIQWAKAINEPFWDLTDSDWLNNSAMNNNWCGTVRRYA